MLPGFRLVETEILVDPERLTKLKEGRHMSETKCITLGNAGYGLWFIEYELKVEAGLDRLIDGTRRSMANLLEVVRSCRDS